MGGLEDIGKHEFRMILLRIHGKSELGQYLLTFQKKILLLFKKTQTYFIDNGIIEDEVRRITKLILFPMWQKQWRLLARVAKRDLRPIHPTFKFKLSKLR